MSNKPHR